MALFQIGAPLFSLFRFGAQATVESAAQAIEI
jgi:hypothetical protein